MTPQELPCEDKLIQLAEESAELAQAAAKLVRAIRNQTPLTPAEALDMLTEEAADVYNCCEVLRLDKIKIRQIARRKMARWEARLNA